MKKDIKITPLSIVGGHEEVAAQASKLIADNYRPRTTGTSDDLASMAASGGFETIAHKIGSGISGNYDMLEIFPELELHAQILASNILAPKDLVTVTFIYGLEDSCLPQDITTKLISIIKKQLDGHYKLCSRAGQTLEKILLTDGAECKVIVPEASLDEFINSRGSGFSATVEHTQDYERGAFKRTAAPIGFFNLSGATVSTVESVYDGGGAGVTAQEEVLTPHTLFTENYEFLTRTVTSNIRTNQLAESIIARRTHTTESSGVGSAFKRISRSYEPIVEIGVSGARESVGRPLYMNVPPESLIIIHKPGEPSKRVAGIMVVNEEGFPLTRETMRTDMTALESSGIKKSSSMGSYLIKNAKDHSVGKGDCISFNEASALYGAIEERALLAKFEDSIFGSNVSIGSSDDGIYRVMLARAIKNAKSRLVFVPAAMLSYIALDYYPNGIGKSILDKLQQINGLRATLLMAGVTREVRNSIPISKVSMDVSPKDPDPFKTVQRGRLLAMNIQASPMPTSAKNFNDYATWARSAGVYFEFGGHPKLPEVKFDFQQQSANMQQQSSDALGNLNDQATMAFGLTPDMIEATRRADFATSIRSRNTMLAKRSLLDQSIVMECYTDRATKICRFDTVISNPCREIISKSLKEIKEWQAESDFPALSLPEDIMDVEAVEIVWAKALQQLRVSLPSPDSGADAELARDFSDYRSALEDVVPSWLAKGSISDLANPEDTEALEVGVIEFFLRRWAIDHNYMPEMFDIPLEPKDSNSGLLADISSYAESMISMARDVSTKLADAKAAANPGGSGSATKATDDHVDGDDADAAAADAPDAPDAPDADADAAPDADVDDAAAPADDAPDAPAADAAPAADEPHPGKDADAF